MSTYKPNGTKFSDYIKMRMLGPETEFRRNQTYVFFLLCIKERCQVRSMTSMYFRKAFKKPGLGSKKLSEVNLTDLARSEASYAIYKNLRGTPAYFAEQKKRAIAMVRQLGNMFVNIITIYILIITSRETGFICHAKCCRENMGRTGYSNIFNNTRR